MVSGSKSNSRNKKSKQKLVFAKDKKQAMAAIIVMALFGVSTIYTVVKLYLEEHPILKPANPELLAKSGGILGQQQTSLKSLGKFAQNVGAGQSTGENAPTVSPLDAQTIETTANLANGINPASPNLIPNPNPRVQTDVEIVSVKQEPLKKNGKMVMVSVVDAGRSNPFLPASENYNSYYRTKTLPYLTMPPETLPVNSEAERVMTTTISGILYDKYSPSAIINIEGSDYLVKKGDVINNYKILAIAKDQVLVQLGKNIYKAGVGEILSQTGLNYNVVANLNKKFGGNEVPINVKRKNY